MSFPFKLPTTRSLSFVGHISSSSHPSLPSTATTYRGVVRDVLKKHKRLPPQSQAPNLPTVVSALEDYIPYLLALDAGLRNQASITATLDSELTPSWSSILAPSPLGKELKKTKSPGIAAELLAALSALATAHSLLARSALHTLYETTAPDAPARKTAIAAAMAHLLSAHGIHTYAQHRAGTTQTALPIDLLPSTQGALAALALATATLAVVLKDDPYPALVAQARNPADTEWMYKAPTLPPVRAHLCARLCLAASAHATRAAAMLAGERARLDAAVAGYGDDVRRVARARALRFLGLDAEGAGRGGEGIAWLRAARAELGGREEEGSEGGLARLKRGWAERREDRKVAKAGAWGADAGVLEEGRVLDLLEAKWVKANDTVNVQTVPAAAPLLAGLPSGREYHSPGPWVPPTLDADTLARMRAPAPDETAGAYDGGSDSSDDGGQAGGDPVGAFPGTGAEYAGGSRYY